MIDWWNGLSTLNQGFYAAAGFFSLLFLWQFIASMIGLAGGDVDIETGAEADVDVDIDVGDGGLDLDDIEAHSIEDAAESTMAFRILSVRAILAFLTLFSWAGAMYLDGGKSTGEALVLAVAWGIGAWVFVAVLIHWMKRLAETGTQRISTCVGKRGSVYLDIPSDGQGEVRVNVSGVISLVKARASGGDALKAGTPVHVVRALEGNSVEVRPVSSPTDGEQPTGPE